MCRTIGLSSKLLRGRSFLHAVPHSSSPQAVVNVLCESRLASNGRQLEVDQSRKNDFFDQSQNMNFGIVTNDGNVEVGQRYCTRDLKDFVRALHLRNVTGMSPLACDAYFLPLTDVPGLMVEDLARKSGVARGETFLATKRNEKYSPGKKSSRKGVPMKIGRGQSKSDGAAESKAYQRTKNAPPT